MAQVTLLPPNTASPTVGDPVSLYGRSSFKLQFTPQASVGFSGTILLEFMIGTMLFLPWYPTTQIDFGAHTGTVVFDLYLAGNYTAIRAEVINPTLGSISGYMAY